MAGPVADRSPRRLVVVRHGKAEAYAADDHGRRLTDRGRAEAAAAGRWLAERGLTPDVALVSTAERTQETWAAARDAAGWAVEPSVDGAVYGGGTDTVLDLVRVLPDDAGVVVVVGHNPTAASLAVLLDDGAGDSSLLVRVSRGFPPGSVAVLEVAGSWQDLDYGAATLADLLTPGQEPG